MKHPGYVNPEIDERKRRPGDVWVRFIEPDAEAHRIVTSSAHSWAAAYDTPPPEVRWLKLLDGRERDGDFTIDLGSRVVCAPVAWNEVWIVSDRWQGHLDHDARTAIGAEIYTRSRSAASGSRDAR